MSLFTSIESNSKYFKNNFCLHNWINYQLMIFFFSVKKNAKKDKCKCRERALTNGIFKEQIHFAPAFASVASQYIFFLLLFELNPIKISETPIRPCNGPNVMETGVGGKFCAVKLWLFCVPPGRGTGGGFH